MMSQRENLKTDENLALMKDLEDRLRIQIDKLEHLRLSIAEAVSPSSEIGFDCIQESNDDLKLLIMDHGDQLARMNERMETLQMNTAVFVQMNTKPRTWNNKQSTKRYNRWPKLTNTDDTRSEMGWSPMRTRRNSDAASEMSCAW